MFVEGTQLLQDILQSLWTPVPPASRAETHLVFSPNPTRAWILGPLNSRLQQEGGSATEKTTNYENKDAALAPAHRTTPPTRLQRPGEVLILHPPGTQRTGVWKRGHTSPKPRVQPGMGKQIKSVLIASRGGGLLHRREAAANGDVPLLQLMFPPLG